MLNSSYSEKLTFSNLEFPRFKKSVPTPTFGELLLAQILLNFKTSIWFLEIRGMGPKAFSDFSITPSASHTKSFAIAILLFFFSFFLALFLDGLAEIFCVISVSSSGRHVFPGQRVFHWKYRQIIVSTS